MYTSRSSTCKRSLDPSSEIVDAAMAFDVFEFPTTLMFIQGSYRTYLGPYSLIALEQYVGTIQVLQGTDTLVMERNIPVAADWWTTVKGYLVQWLRYSLD